MVPQEFDTSDHYQQQQQQQQQQQHHHQQPPRAPGPSILRRPTTATTPTTTTTTPNNRIPPETFPPHPHPIRTTTRPPLSPSATSVPDLPTPTANTNTTRVRFEGGDEVPGGDGVGRKRWDEGAM
jgi:hypothetical protein